MNDIEVLEGVQIGNIVIRLCHNPVGQRYYVEKWDDQQSNGKPWNRPFSYKQVGGQTKIEALALATAEFRRLICLPPNTLNNLE